MTALTVNDRPIDYRMDPATPLLWALRDASNLPGTKYGCGIAQCGSCTVHIDGEAARSCVMPVSAVAGKTVTTIEGLSENGDHPLQKAWLANKVPQCGYCQAGQIMNAASFLATNKTPSSDDIDNAMQGNICRCGTYQRIKQAVSDAADEMYKEA
jgi:aerobic-type carbon monoxide dehydrogenase small subunit (CoxS/CutS family)